MKYDITPSAKPRMTQSDKWKKRPIVMRYRAFRDEVRLKKVAFNNGDRIVFGVPMPKSWSKQKKEIYEYQANEQVPDVDNYLKALLDSIFDDDSHIWHIGDMRKIWAYKGFIEIRTEP